MAIKTNKTVTLRYNLKWSDATDVDIRKQKGLSFVLTLPNDTTVTITDCGYDHMKNQVWVRINGDHISTAGKYKGNLSVLTTDLQMVTTGLVDLFTAAADGTEKVNVFGLAVNVIQTPVNQGQGYSPKIVDGVWFVYDDALGSYVSTGQSVVAKESVDAFLEDAQEELNEKTAEISKGKIGIINCLDGNFFEYEKENLKIKTCARFDILTQGKIQRINYSGGDYTIVLGNTREQAVYFNTETNTFGNKGYANTTFTDKEIIIGIVDTTTKNGTFNFIQKIEIKESDIANSSISTSKIADKAVKSEKLDDSSVSTSKIADEAVTPEKTIFFQAGKNIINFTSLVPYSNIGGTTGTYSVKEANVNTAANESYIKVKPNTKYALSFELDGTGVFFWYDENKTFLGKGSSPKETSLSNASYCRVQFYKLNSTEYLATASKIQLEEGEEYTEYEAPHKVFAEEYYNEQYLKGIVEKYADTKDTNTQSIYERFDAVMPKAVSRGTSFNFGFVTDTHIEGENGENSGLIDIKTISMLAKNGYLDFVAHGGDLFNSYATGAVNGSQGITLETAIKRINYAMKYFEVFNCPLIVARGNHDVNVKYKPNYPDEEVDLNQKITKLQFSNLLQNARLGNVEGRHECSFYKDFDDKKIRVITLDVYVRDNQSASFNHDTLNFIVGALKSNKNGYGVILITHTLNTSPLPILQELISKFKNGGTFTNTTYDVSETFDGGGEFIACIAGHTHNEEESADNGFLYLTSSTSYLKTNADVRYNIFANVFSIDRENKIIYKQKLGLLGNNVACNWETLTITEIN